MKIARSEWRDVALEDVADELTVGFVGSMASEYVDDGIPFLRSLNVEPLRINKNDLKFITPEFHQRIRKSSLTPGDVVIVRTGKPGACSVVPEWLADANCSDLVIVRCGKQLNNRFLAYYVNTVASGHVAAHLVGAVQQHFNVGSARQLRVNLPPLAEQEAIIAVLGALDDKIELNRRMNETLEGMARALFKSWFVDFDPVRAKLDRGAHPNLDSVTAVLFPGSFVRSGSDLTPKGWFVRTIGDVVDVKHGYAFEGQYFCDGPSGDMLLTPGNFIAGGGFKDEKVKYYVGPVPAEYVLEEGDLLLTMTDLSKESDTLGYPALLPAAPSNHRFLHNQRLGKVIVTDRHAVNRYFLYQLFCGDAYRDEILAGASGTTVKHTSPSRIKAFKTVLPSPEVMTAFERVTAPWHSMALAKRRESHTLAALRDALLPKLLSGEIRIPAAEKLANEVA